MRIAGLLLLLGLVIGTALVAWFGAGAVVATLLTIGWGGFLAVCGFHILLIVLNGLAWWILTPDVAPRRWGMLGAWGMFIWARLVRTAAAEILPLSQLGGPVAGIRLTMLHGIPGGVAAAAVIVDVALEFLTQLAYAVLGLALLAARGSGSDLLLPAAAWVVVAMGLCAGFIVVQRRGGGLVEKLSPFIAKRFSADLPGAMEAVTAALTRVYARRTALVASTILHLVEWLATGVEAWLALRFMNVPVSLASATGIEALLYAVRSAAFMVPVAAGIQEGGYLLVGAAFGLTPDQALALSLLKRGRDLALGIPPLVGWQILESGRWWRRSVTPDKATGDSKEPAGPTDD
jgi:putative membrane protein